MEESECIVCFSRYDDEEHRPRFIPCGHTICSQCLETAIREESKMCPKCRATFSASNVKELLVNFSLESMVKSLNNTKNTEADKQTECTEQQFPIESKSSENTKEDKLSECAEHQLPVGHRCSTHKAWICQSCLTEDHSSESCKIITINEELNIKKAIMLDQSQPLLTIFEETCSKSDNCMKQCVKLIQDNDEDIIKSETMMKKSQEEIQDKKATKMQMEKNYPIFYQKLELLKSRRRSFDNAVTSLKSSETIRDVSQCSIEVQKETKKLQLISQEIENEIDLILQAFNYKIPRLPLDGINESTHQSTMEKTSLEERVDQLQGDLSEDRMMNQIIKGNIGSAPVWLWLAAIFFAGFALGYGFSMADKQLSAQSDSLMVTRDISQGKGFDSQELPLSNTGILREEESSRSGQIKSPNYPQQHGNNEHHEWIIIAPEGSKIVLSFMTFELDSCCDFLEIRDGDSNSSPLIHKLTDNHWADITSPGNRLHIKFTSDSHITRNGFYITWDFERPSPIRTVEQYAPKLRFDSKFGSKNKCFPSSASDYYNERASDNWNRICNTHYNTITSGSVPTYWRAMECKEDLHIAYWFFTGYQDSCFLGGGSHNSDWEHIVVKVENYKTSAKTLDAVIFYQHDGWYTKKPGQYEVDGTHPIVYSGKNSHGSYHDNGGTGGCAYFQDFRNPGRKNQFMETWLNLEELRRNESKPDFMKDMSSKDKFEMKSPLEQAVTYEMCTLKGCYSSGCQKSKIYEDEFF